MASNKRGRSEKTNGKVDIDPDLTCAVCTELVVDARQVGCCGNIYCKDCIVEWLSRNKPGSCPNCRAALIVSKLIIDKRTERQSADHQRNCKFFETYGCAFIGNRKAVHEHQQCCSFNPDACKNPYCQTLHALEVDRQRKGDDTLNHTKDILANIWRSPEDALKMLYELQMVKLFEIKDKDTSCDVSYEMSFAWKVENYKCVIDCAHHNVSIMCSATDAAHNRTILFVLIHPADPTLNHDIEISIARIGCTIKRGNLNWMTEEKFKTFVMNGKFALGLKAIPFVPAPEI